MKVLPAPTPDGGWALTDWPRAHYVSTVNHQADVEPSYACCDAWEPPHRLAFGSDLCDAILASAEEVEPQSSGNGTYYLDHLTPALQAEVYGRFADANRQWWGLDIDQWDGGVKSYGPGERHPLHQDLHAGAARRKFAGVVQLSETDDYTGGALVMQFSTHRVAMPRTRGTLVAFPGWTVHEVEPVTSGIRWSLCVNGRGPRLR
jgi:hypothetical protein